MDNDNWGQKCQNSAFIICGSPAISLSYPNDSGHPRAAKVTALQRRKMEHLKFLASDYKERVGFVFLGRKREMF